ncbi:MAG: formate dehydrogenase accessory sulfurtransferase FdhD [Pseudomonadota bacterium]
MSATRDLTGPLPDPSPLVRGRLGTGREALWRVPEEVPVAFLLNGESFAVMMATPADLEEFALGFALTEGIVAAPDEISRLAIAEAAEGFVVNLAVDPAQAARVAARKRSFAGRAGCGICGAQTVAAALPRPPQVRGPRPTAAALASAFDALAATQAMNAENRSTHAAAFCDASGGILVTREDIGRHNALDKLGGALARSRRAAREGFVLLSSRISVEMVQKAAMLGAPFLAALSAPSALALRVAARAGMGLAARAGGDVMVFAPETWETSGISGVPAA